MFFGLAMLVPALLLDSFATLLDDVILVDTVTLAVLASTLFVLRRGAGDAPGFIMWGFLVLPVFYCVCLLAVAVHVIQPTLAVAGGVILLTGWPLFRFDRRLFAVTV